MSYHSRFLLGWCHRADCEEGALERVVHVCFAAVPMPVLIADTNVGCALSRGELKFSIEEVYRAAIFDNKAFDDPQDWLCISLPSLSNDAVPETTGPSSPLPKRARWTRYYGQTLTKQARTEEAAP